MPRAPGDTIAPDDPREARPLLLAADLACGKPECDEPRLQRAAEALVADQRQAGLAALREACPSPRPALTRHLGQAAPSSVAALFAWSPHSSTTSDGSTTTR